MIVMHCDRSSWGEKIDHITADEANENFNGVSVCWHPVGTPSGAFKLQGAGWKEN